MPRELVYTGFMSLDGVVDSPGSREEGHRNGGWVMETEFVPEAFSLKGEELEDTAALMFGRHSYGVFAPVWRDSEDHAAYKDIPKYVVSSTMTPDDIVDGWGATELLSSEADVARVKAADGGAIYIHGSAELARRLFEADLIDRYNLLVFPVLLGEGKTLFPRDDRESRRLKLRESAAYSNGVAKLIYEVVR